MADAICKVVIPGHFEESFLVVKELLRNKGFSIANPDNGVISCRTVAGDVIEILENEVGDVRNFYSLYFWLDEVTSLSVSWEDAGRNGWGFNINLSGLAGEYCRDIIKGLNDMWWARYGRMYSEINAITVIFV